MSTVIKLRRGTATEWSSNGSTVLASGEPGFELDTGRLKIGDGTTAWSGLYYATIIPTGLIAGSGVDITLGSNGEYATISVTGNVNPFAIGSIDLHNGGVQNAQILQFDDSNYQSVITGPVPPSGNNAQRLIIQGQKGVGGEGGDVYLWGGDADSNGGDIKIYAGDADNVSSGQGGYVNIDGGNGYDQGGNIGITAGNSTLQGGNVTIIGGSPSGTVMLSSNGGSYDWLFNNDGSVTFPDTTVQTTAWTGTIDSSQINDFNSAVSGLLPVKDIVAGTGISISSTTGVYTITSTGSGVLADQSSSLVTTVFNSTGSPIPKMTAVYINGGQGDQPTVQLAVATGDATSAGTYGVTFESISNMSTGKVIVFGALTGVNTDQFNPTAPTGNVNGTVLYLSPTTPGGLTTTKPSAPNHIVAIGTIVRTHQNAGVIEVRVQNGFELEELHNVAISGATNGQFLQYNSSSGLWVPSSSGNFTTLQLNGTTVSVTGHTHTSSNISDFNSSVSGLLPVKDIIAGSGVSVSSVSGSYTISATGTGGGATITNYADNRILTSDGTSTGINGESNLTFDGSNLNISGNLIAKSGSFLEGSYGITIEPTIDNTNGAHYINFKGNNIVGSIFADEDGEYLGFSGSWRFFGQQVNISNQTINTIASFDGSKNVVSLSTGTYPSLTELSYVKGVTSAIQTQLNSKQNTLTNPVTGTGVANHIAYWNSSSGIVADSGQLYWDSTNNRLGIGTITPSTELDVIGSGSFVSGVNVGGAAVTGLITGLSTTATVPSIRFQSITANHTAGNHLIFDWYKNISTRLFYITGAGSFYADSSNGNFAAGSTNPSTGNGAFIGNGMRRHDTNVGMDFTWGESITSTSEPGIDLYPIGGTHIASGILLRLSKNSAKTDIAMLVNGSGNVGIGTTTPTARLQVVGQGVFNSGIVTTTGNFTTSITSSLLNIDNLRLDSNTISSTNSNGNILLTPNGTGKVGIGNITPAYTLEVDGTINATQNIYVNEFPVSVEYSPVSGSIVSSTIDTDASNTKILDIILTENVTLNNPTNSYNGATIRWRIQQDGTGGRTVTLDTKFQIPSSASNPLPWSTGANAMDTLAATYHSGRDKWDVVAFVPGY